MTPAWTDEDLACLARDYRNHPDVYDLIEGVRRVLALCAEDEFTFTDEDGNVQRMTAYVLPRKVRDALNDPPNGATP